MMTFYKVINFRLIKGNYMDITPKLLSQINSNSLYTAIGIKIEGAVDGHANSILKPDSKFCWPHPTQPHGGVLFTLMDTTMALATLSLLGEDHNCSTINLDIQYILPATEDPFTCEAWVIRKTRRMSFTRGEIRDAKGQILAIGQANIRIFNETKWP